LIRLDASMRPIGAVWLRRPTVADDDGEPMPNPDAVLANGGWYLPDASVTTAEHAARSSLA
jgi:hypothetical protein